MKQLLNMCRDFFNLVCRTPKILTPFIIATILDFLLLYILYLAPQYPVSVLLGPPIYVFFGEQFLHYPQNLFILPKLYYYGHMVLLATVGVAMTGFGIGVLAQAREHKPITLLPQFLQALRRYFALLTLGILMFAFSFILGKAIQKLPVWCAYVLYIAPILVQIFLLYAMAALLLQRKSIVQALATAVQLFKRCILETLFLGIIVVLCYIPIWIIKRNAFAISMRLTPEAIVYIFGLGIIVTFILDVCVVAVATLLFLKETND